jgi:Zn-dependent alcohol dehydrogenase
VVIYGIGGVGINAVQGAAFAGAQHIIAVDPLPNKREFAEQFGATHSAPDAAQAQELATDLTRGVGADKALMTMGVVTQEAVDAAFAVIRKGGTVVVTGLNGPGVKNIQIPSFELTLFQKRIHGALFGGGNPFDDIPRMLELYRSGHLKLDELVTNRYRLEEVNQGYRDLTDGKNLRGVMIIDR